MKAILVALAILLALPAGATARTPVHHAPRLMHRRRRRTPHAPVPPRPSSPAPQVVDQPCPYTAVLSVGCFYAKGATGDGPPTVYVDLAEGGPWTLEHEMGHAFIAEYASPGDKNAIARYLHRRHGYTPGAEEDAADLYATCRLDIPPTSAAWALTRMSVERWLRICGLFTRVYASP